MDRDLRLYTYEVSGILHKLGRTKKFHNHSSIESAENVITYARKKGNKWQIVLIDYTDKYKSKIIRIYDGI